MESSPSESEKNNAPGHSQQSIPFTHILVCSIGLTILTGLTLPLGFIKKYKADISITATGVRNDKAKGVEVWVSETQGPGIVASSTAAGWERRGNAQVSYQSQPATLHWEGAIDPEYQLSFVRHAYSGQMVLDINGHKTEYSLFAEKDIEPLKIRPYDLMKNPETTYRRQPLYKSSNVNIVLTMTGMFFIIHLAILVIIRKIY